ncbi:hypothetical protein Droror1_Dr00001310 [Drosera rotundifolia]
MDVLLMMLASLKPVGSGTSLVSKNDFVINSSVVSSLTGYVRYFPMAFMVKVILSIGEMWSMSKIRVLPFDEFSLVWIGNQEKVRYSLVKNVEDYQVGIYDKPLPCFGCGKGWFCFLVGFLFPPLWYYATVLYFGNYYRKDPRERAGLAASAVAAMACTIVVLIVILATLL